MNLDCYIDEYTIGLINRYKPHLFLGSVSKPSPIFLLNREPEIISLPIELVVALSNLSSKWSISVDDTLNVCADTILNHKYPAIKSEGFKYQFDIDISLSTENIEDKIIHRALEHNVDIGKPRRIKHTVKDINQHLLQQPSFDKQPLCTRYKKAIKAGIIREVQCTSP